VFQGRRAVGVTAGASAPEVLVRSLVQALQDLGGRLEAFPPLIREDVSFPLPRALRTTG
jgi:4-hydroxy-3-methylbut-2-enyl diphosphate reductase